MKTNLRVNLLDPGIVSSKLRAAAFPLEDPTKLRFIRRCLIPGGMLLSPDRALSNALRDAGYSRIRVPWFNPLVEAMR